MQTVYIKFLNEADRARGFFEIAKRLRVGSFPGQVYQVPLAAMQMLDEIHVAYRRATDSEVKDSHNQVRYPTAAVL